MAARCLAKRHHPVLAITKERPLGFRSDFRDLYARQWLAQAIQGASKSESEGGAEGLHEDLRAELGRSAIHVAERNGAPGCGPAREELIGAVVSARGPEDLVEGSGGISKVESVGPEGAGAAGKSINRYQNHAPEGQ